MQLNEYEMNSSLMPFEKWQTGEELFSNLDREHDLLDRDLRPFLEECDQLQGIQIFSGIDDAWGGFTARYLERISDELGKGSRWIFGFNNANPTSRQRHMLQVANLAQSLYSLDSSASLHIPTLLSARTLPTYVTLDTASPWHTSALQTAMVESITLPARLHSSDPARATFDQLETTLNNDGNRRIVAAGMSVDDPGHLQSETVDGSQQDTRMTNGITHEDDETKEPKVDIDMFDNVVSEQGRHSGRRTHTFSNIESLRGPWKSATDIEVSNEDSHDRFINGMRTSIHQAQLLFPLLPSYPRIFRFAGRPESLAVKATLTTSTRVANHIRELGGSARRMVGIDEREALCDGLAGMAEEYEEGWSEGDDSDNDED